MIQIAIINESSAISDDEVQRYVPALQKQWTNDLKPIWGLDDATFAFAPKGEPPSPNALWVVFLDDPGQADQLAYHDLTNDGLPIAKVLVKKILADNASVSAGASHEICEMAVDPWLNRCHQDPQAAFWAGEVCDPVQNDRYGYTIDGILMSDFVTPTWFAHRNATGKMDFGEHVQAQFEILPGGYAQKFDPQIGWHQVTGIQAGQTAAATPNEGSRRERRARGTQLWKNSTVSF